MSITTADRDALISVVLAIPVDDLQEELDGVNAELDAVRSQVAIALAVASDAGYTDAQKLQLITETLGPQ